VKYGRCFVPTAHRPHDWYRNGELVTCAGHALNRTTAERTALTPQAPLNIRSLLHHPGVTWRTDEENAAIAVLIPADLAESLADQAPDPVIFRLAARDVAAGAMDEDERADLLRTERYL
jgi:hypothetical protein